MKKKDNMEKFDSENIANLDKLVKFFADKNISEKRISNSIRDIDSLSRLKMEKLASLHHYDDLSEKINKVNSNLNDKIIDEFEKSVENKNSIKYLHSIDYNNVLMLSEIYDYSRFENDLNPEVKDVYAGELAGFITLTKVLRRFSR